MHIDNSNNPRRALADCIQRGYFVPLCQGRLSVLLHKLLLNFGADLHATNPREEGMMPLHHAAESSAPTEVVKLLLHSGASINATAAATGWTPLDYALDRGHESVTQLLRSCGANPSGIPPM